MANHKKTHPAYRWPWPKVRARILERDLHQCQIQMAGCTQIATTVDHIVPVTQGGAWWDDANLRAACRHCNNQRIERKPTEAWKTAATHIVLVIGPPAAGKSTWVEMNARAGDLIVDYDRLAASMGGTPHTHGDQLHTVINAARNGILQTLRKGQAGCARAFIISANPDAENIFPHHQVQVIDPGQEQVKARAHAAGRPATFQRLIDDWYRARANAGTDEQQSRSW